MECRIFYFRRRRRSLSTSLVSESATLSTLFIQIYSRFSAEIRARSSEDQRAIQEGGRRERGRSDSARSGKEGMGRTTTEIETVAGFGDAVEERTRRTDGRTPRFILTRLSFRLIERGTREREREGKKERNALAHVTSSSALRQQPTNKKEERLKKRWIPPPFCPPRNNSFPENRTLSQSLNEERRKAD